MRFCLSLFIGFALTLSISACGKKGKLVNPTPNNPYPRTYPSLPKSFGKKIEKKEDKKSEENLKPQD
jgi:predicted small lipoprotein YifL